MKSLAAFLSVALFLYLLALLPASYSEEVRKGCDATIYYRAGHGDTAYVPAACPAPVPAWAYSDRTLPLFRLWSRLPFPMFYASIYLLSALGVCHVLYRSLILAPRYPYLAGLLAFLVGWYASDVVCSGNLHAMLAGASLSPAGALVACCVKPWYGAALLVVHAVRATARLCPRDQRRVSWLPDRAGNDSLVGGADGRAAA